MTFEFWDIVISPRFLIPLALIVAGFAPILYSIRKTYAANGEERDVDRTYD